MSEPANLASEITNQLPPELADFLKSAGAMADSRGEKLCLVGGVARDLLLDRPTLDIDLVVEGDALSLIQQLPQIDQAKITTHPSFGTAKIKWQKWSLDFTTARSETYAKPGALPTVKPGSLKDDLFRRDFTINAMAVYLSPARFGALVDLYEGRKDLGQKLIRVLHDNSFTDDATRIWRAVRYEQRLDFKIEPHTLELLKRDIPMLDTITGDRIRYEVECVLGEELPEKALRRAYQMGVLARLNPMLRADDWLAERFRRARQYYDVPPIGLYLALLTYPLNEPQAGDVISYLKLPKAQARVVLDSIALGEKLTLLADPGITPGRTYRLLHGYSPLALMANSLATESPAIQEHIQLFLAKLRYVKPALNGNDLVGMGIPPGPRIKEILERLRDARLDGEVKSREAEVELVRHLFNHRHDGA